MYLDFILDFTGFWMSSRLKGVMEIQIQEIYRYMVFILLQVCFQAPLKEKLVVM